MSLDPRLLQSFVALADELHFGRAAEQLHLSQPTLSQQIARLERQLGTLLFARTRRRVELTEAGAAVLAPARAAVDSATMVVQAAREHAGGQRGILRLGLSPGAHYAAQVLVGDLLTDGDIRVLVRHEPSALLVEHVAARDLDVAMSFCSDVSDGVAKETLLDEQAILALAPTHPLAARKRVDLRDLAGETLALADQRDAPGYNRAVLGIVERAGLRLPTSDPKAGPMAWENAVATGCVGFTTRSSVHATAATFQLVPIEQRATFAVELLYPAIDAMSPLAARFCRAARAMAHEGRLLAGGADESRP